jgi:hypothetical protein
MRGEDGMSLQLRTKRLCGSRVVIGWCEKKRDASF